MRSTRAKGFSLLELVAIITILGILSALVLPRFSGRSGIAEYTLRDQIVSILRFAQQRAMYDHSGACYGVNINATSVTAEQNGSIILGTEPIALTGDYQGYSATPLTVFFDGLGSPKTGGIDCANSSVAAVAITVTSSAGSTLQIAISTAGYVEKI